jgi:hypothetical protein
VMGCQVMLAMVLYSFRVMLGMVLPIHAGDGTAEVTWSRRNVDPESY